MDPSAPKQELNVEMNSAQAAREAAQEGGRMWFLTIRHVHAGICRKNKTVKLPKVKLNKSYGHFPRVPTCVKESCSSQMLWVHGGILWPILKCRQSHLLRLHVRVLWVIGQGWLLSAHPLQDTQDLPIHSIQDVLQGAQHLLDPDILLAEVITGREVSQVRPEGAISTSPFRQDTPTAETLHFIRGTHIEESSLRQGLGRHRGILGPLTERPQPPGPAPHAGIEELPASTPGLRWCCIPHGCPLQEKSSEPRAVSCIPSSRQLSPHVIIPAPLAHSGKLLLTTKPSSFGKGSPVTDLVFLYFAGELLLSPHWCLMGIVQHFPRPSANLQERWNREGREKAVLPPRLKQGNLWESDLQDKPPAFCSAFELSFKRLCFSVSKPSMSKNRTATPLSQSSIYS